MNNTTLTRLNSLTALYKHHRHVAVKIESTWGTPKCHNLLVNYLIKDRDHRTGFTHEVYKEIITLYLLHKQRYNYEDDFRYNLELLNIYRD